MSAGAGWLLSCPSCSSCLALPETWPWFGGSGCVVRLLRLLTAYCHCHTLCSVRGTKVGPVPCERGAEARQSYIPQPLNLMSITIQLDLPEALAREAKAKGLLEPQRLETLIKDELVSPEALKNYREMVDQMRAYPDEPMTMDEIQAEVDAVRAERAARRESGR
jgi:hypothetical protein